MSYQVTKALPYFFRRYVFRDTSARLEPLYHFEGVVLDEGEEDKTPKKLNEKL